MNYPANGGFMVAAYTVAAVLILAYVVNLVVRLRRASRESRDD